MKVDLLIQIKDFFYLYPTYTVKHATCVGSNDCNAIFFVSVGEHAQFRDRNLELARFEYWIFTMFFSVEVFKVPISNVSVKEHQVCEI